MLPECLDQDGVVYSICSPSVTENCCPFADYIISGQPVWYQTCNQQSCDASKITTWLLIIYCIYYKHYNYGFLIANAMKKYYHKKQVWNYCQRHKPIYMSLLKSSKDILYSTVQCIISFIKLSIMETVVDWSY